MFPEDIPPALAFCRHLVQLDLSYNKLNALPGFLYQMKKQLNVRILLEGNPIYQKQSIASLHHTYPAIYTRMPEKTADEPKPKVESLMMQAIKTVEKHKLR